MTTTVRNTPAPSTSAAIAQRQAEVSDLPPEQRPRFFSIPPGDLDFSLGDEAVELATRANLKLDLWQALALRASLARRHDGRLAAFEVGVNVARQNGKGAILEARELAGVFILEHALTIHSAHQFDTSLEAFRRLLWLIEETPELDQQVKRVTRSHGEEGIEFKGNRRVRFRTRTGGGGRGFSGNGLILDEAMYLRDSFHGALLPTLSAQSMYGDPQVWYTGSAVDQLVHPDGLVFTRIRNRGIVGDDDLVYVEYSAEGELEDAEYVADDPEAWQAANPGLGIRISAGHIAKERKSMDLRTFAVERLGIGDWPNVEEEDEFRIDPRVWEALTDKSDVPAPLTLALDTRPDRSKTAISAAGYADDGLPHVRIVEHRDGTGWVVKRLVELAEELEADGVAIDGQSPAASLIPQIENEGITVHVITTPEHAKACGLFFDLVKDEEMRHAGNPELTSAIKGSARRPLADAWAWSRKNSATDISPLVASTLALWRAVNAGSNVPLFAVM